MKHREQIPTRKLCLKNTVFFVYPFSGLSLAKEGNVACREAFSRGVCPVDKNAVKTEESPLQPSIPIWTQLEIDGGMMCEHRVKKKAHLEEMRVVRERK